MRDPSSGVLGNDLPDSCGSVPVGAPRVQFVLNEMLAESGDRARVDIVSSKQFRRTHCALLDGSDVLLDTFPGFDGASCGFVRLPLGNRRKVRLVVRGVDEVVHCAAGGWLLRERHGDAKSLVFWMPQPPAIRTVDAHGRILSQQLAALVGFGGTSDQLWADFDVPKDAHLDVTLWRLSETLDAEPALQAPLALERQPLFLRSSHSVFGGLADLYLCLVHGHVYDNRFVWRRIWGGYRWRICSENEAHSLYVALNGLERATKRAFYTLVKRQVLFSVIARQAADGGWHHGEWTDLMESHFRLHNAGVLVLEAALEEVSDPVVAKSLERAIGFSASCTDNTDVGVWFLHDSLEASVEMATAKEAPPYTPTRVLGASPTNKLILNTHLDALVALDRYSEVTCDARHTAAVTSGRAAARAVLALRPAEWLYRMTYKAVWLTLLPPEECKRLALPLRAVRRLARDYLNPRLYHLKRMFPRFVMPGGLIDRHLSPKHFDMGYHPSNLMDIARLSRRFPEDGFDAVINGAVEAVAGTSLLKFWMASKHRQPIGYWVEALYHLCTLHQSREYRGFLAQAMLCAEDADLGLPPALLGADPEAVKPPHQVPCPSPRDARLRVANLSCGGRREFLVVNPSDTAIDLAWDGFEVHGLSWVAADDRAVRESDERLAVPSRGWLLGYGS